MITQEQINKLASRKGVRKIAVENFLGTIDCTLRKWDHLANMGMDGRLYNWNAPTIAAIRRGIELAYK